MDSTALLTQLCRMIIPEVLLEHFDIVNIEEKKEEWQVTLHEKPDHIPKDLQGKETSMDGFLNPVELFTFPQKDKRLYLKVYRRRWKEKGSSTASHNTYDLYEPGAKVTKEFGAFLKELGR